MVFNQENTFSRPKVSFKQNNFFRKKYLKGRNRRSPVTNRISTEAQFGKLKAKFQQIPNLATSH